MFGVAFVIDGDEWVGIEGLLVEDWGIVVLTVLVNMHGLPCELKIPFASGIVVIPGSIVFITHPLQSIVFCPTESSLIALMFVKVIGHIAFFIPIEIMFLACVIVYDVF